MPEKLITVKPNFVLQEPDRTVINNDKGSFYLYVGRLELEKGIWIVVNAFLDMPERELIVIGIGSQETAIRNLITMKQCQNIRLLGKMKHDDTVAYIQQAKAIVIPSCWYEGFPVVMLEAMVNCTVPICTDFGNVGQLNRDYGIGLEFNGNDKDSLVYTIRNGDDMLIEKAKTIRDTYDKYFSKEKNLQMLLAIYKQVIDKRKGRIQNR